MGAEPEIITPVKSGAFTRVTAWVRLGRGVVGNTTFGLWGICLLGIPVCITFTVCGYPGYGLIALAMIMVFYWVYQVTTWVGVSRAPDAGALADEDYAHLRVIQMAAKNPALVDSSMVPAPGGTGVAPTSQGGRQ